MTSHTGRLYSLALALVVFFLVWVVIAAHPWVSAKPDPRLAALAVRERQVRRESIAVQRLVQQRWSVYRVQLKARRAQIASAQHAQLVAAASPSVRVVALPPLTVTRTS